MTTIVRLPAPRPRADRRGSPAGARRAAGLGLGLLVLAGSLQARGPDAGDPQVEGNWLGQAGPPQDRVEIGLALRRGPDGKLAARFYQPVVNYYEIEVPGAVEWDGTHLVVDALGLDLESRNGRLEGTLGGPKLPVTLSKVDEIPPEPPMPVLPSGPEPRWETRLGGEVFATPELLDAKVYVGTTGGVLNAVNVADGSFAWTMSAGRPIFGAPLATEDAIYFVCDNGYLFKLARDTGKEIWRFDLGDARVPRILPHPVVFDWDQRGPRPAILDGVVYVGSGDGTFHAVDGQTGASRWRFATGDKLREGALVTDEMVVFGGNDHFVYALARDTGRELWRRDLRAVVDNTPVLVGDSVVVGNRGGGLYGLDRRSGEIVWRSLYWGSWVESTPALVDGTLYVGSSDQRRVSAIDPTDGRPLWRSDVYGWSWGTPAVTADRIYVGVAGGTPYFIRHVASLSALDRATGRLVWRRPIPAPAGAHQWGIAGSPVLVGDDLVVATIDGGLFAYPLK